ncbi:MAG: DNA primase [Candidatus Nanosyncoccaceae bacterium]|jgi:DNA primase
MNDAKEEIRERLAIEDVIGEYIELKRAGRNFKALSPFNQEKTPSFMVSPDKKIWHDFSSGKGGDIFTFVMEMEGYDFPEALKHLARKAGVELKQYSSANSKRIAQRKARERQMYEVATKFYQVCLARNGHALDYALKQRHLTRDTLRDFSIGYSPNLKDSLVRFLSKQGYSQNEIIQAGLTNQYGGDLFRGRLMIPLSDQNGQVIGYTGRGLEADSIPKYLNTPATLLYDKSRHVFALFQAKEAIRKSNQIVVVEGNMDAISSHQAGVKNVVATAGTAMTVVHLKTLARFASDVRLAFDSDDAGLRATERVIELSQGLAIDLRIISMPDSAKDPDELINQDIRLWQKAIKQAVPAVDWLIAQYSRHYDLKAVPGKRDFSRKLMATVRKLIDPVEREAYTNKIAEMLEISVEALLEQTKINRKSTRRKRPAKEVTNSGIDEYIYQDNLLALAIISAEARRQLAKLDSKMLVGEERKVLAEFFAKQPTKPSKLKASDLPKSVVRAKVLMLRAEEQFSSWKIGEIKEQVAHLIEQTKIDYQKRETQKLTEALRQAEAVGDEKLAKDLSIQLNEIIKQTKK